MPARAPISVIIPTLNSGRDLRATLSALAPAAVDGLVREVIVADGGSTDDTGAIAEAAGARIVSAPPGRGVQLLAGAGAARGDWLLFLHADTVLEFGWALEAQAFITSGKARAAVFTLAFDATGFAPRLVAGGAMIRTRIARLPYGDQGLLIAREHYDELGGFRPLPLMEDVDFIDRLKSRGGFSVLKAKAVTSARRYERDGYAARVFKNACCIVMYRLGVDIEQISSFYK